MMVRVWRYLSGHTMSGPARTDATWFRFGRTSIRPSDRPMRWAYLPRALRALLRVLSVPGVYVAGWLYFTVPEVLLYCAITASVFLIGYGVLLGADWRKSTAHQRMPMRVSPRKVRGELELSDSGSPLIGLSYGKEPIRLDLDNEAPHVALSMGVGAGKSSVLLGIAVQGLKAGWEEITVIDPKYVSLAPISRDPRVNYCRTWEEQWNAIKAFKQMMDERYSMLNEDETLTFPRRVLILEEGNSWAEEMYLYWTTILKGKGKCPIITDLAFILFKGRQVNCNIIGAWQRLSVRAIGSGDARDQFGTKMLARFSQQAWMSLVGTNPKPRSSRHPGRCILVTGERQIPVQLVYWTPSEAKMYAQQSLTCVPTGSGKNDDLEIPPPSTISVRTGEGVSLVKDEPVKYVTLREAFDTGLITHLSTFQSLRATRSQDKAFPVEVLGMRGQGGALMYDPALLVAWNNSRRSVIRANAEGKSA